MADPNQIATHCRNTFTKAQALQLCEVLGLLAHKDVEQFMEMLSGENRYMDISIDRSQEDAEK